MAITEEIKSNKTGLSARKVMAILFSITYCLVILICTIAMLKKVLAVETAVALIAAFALIVREIADDYFSRNDRPNPNVSPEQQNGQPKPP